MYNKPIRILGYKKSDFDKLVEKGVILLRDARLIPYFKMGDEVGLASVLLSSMRMIREFRRMILSDLNMKKGGHFYAYNEVVFPQFKNCRIDGLILIEMGGVIKDAAVFEMKNGSNEVNREQIEKYIDLARSCSIPRIVTVSNQFVSEPTQSPVNVKSIKSVNQYHFSWSYILTLAHILLFDNEINIEDPDQVELMKEIVKYFEYDKSGICGFTQMKKGWGEIVEKINLGTRVKLSDSDLDETVISWEQEEKDLALILSKNLGIFVTSGETKYKGDLDSRIRDDKKRLKEERILSSNLKVKNAVSDIKIDASFEKKTVEMSVILKAPQDKTIRGQLSWIKRQLGKCKKKNTKKFLKVQQEILIDISLKNTSKSERVNIDNLDNIYNEIKDREIKEFKVMMIRDFSRNFSSCKKFVEIIEEMLLDYYSGIVQSLTKWEEPAPKMKEDEKDVNKNSSVKSKKIKLSKLKK